MLKTIYVKEPEKEQSVSTNQSNVIQVMKILVLRLLWKKHDVSTHKVRVSLDLTRLYWKEYPK